MAGLSLPVVDSDGAEYHLFNIAGARGGNASAAIHYWAVVVRPDGAVWASGNFSMTEPTAARPDKGSGLTLEERVTTTSSGARYAIVFGSLSRTTLPMLPSSVVSKEARVLVGQVEGGYHGDNWRRRVQGVAIDDDSACPFLQNARAVRASVEVTKWSDGRTTVKCLLAIPP